MRPPGSSAKSAPSAALCRPRPSDHHSFRHDSPRTGPYEARGFAFLKKGKPEFAIPEYEAALAIVPNRALSLYGRSLARRKAGYAKAGTVDKASALALDPNIARQFSMFGLE